MISTRWFGGWASHDDHRANPLPPPTSDPVRTHDPRRLWLTGHWPEAELRSAHGPHRHVTVVGYCSATSDDLQHLAYAGVADSVVTAFAGAYTVVETRPDCTVIFTDPGHVQPVYWIPTPRGTVWASSSLALARLANAEPDLHWLVATLLAPDQPQLHTGRSGFAGVRLVPPGTRAVVTADRVVTRLVWDPPPSTGSFARGADQLHAVLDDAVRLRVAGRRRPTTDCSGGLDSTTLTLLAAGHLDESCTLHAVTVHPAATAAGGDMDYARLATVRQPAITHRLCPLEEAHLPYSRMLDLVPPTDEPAPTTVAVARAVAEFDLLRRAGSDCHLTGDGGDTLLLGHPADLADLVQRRRWRHLWRDAIGWARLYRTSVWPRLLDVSQTARRRTARTTRSRPLLARGHQALPSWVTPRAHDLLTEVVNDAEQLGELDAPSAWRVAAMQVVGRTSRADAQIAEYYGVHVQNPFTDARVLEAVVEVPSWDRGSAYAYKPLLTAAMANLLPTPIANRITKGDFTVDHYLGLRRNLSSLHDLADGQLAALDLVDPERLRHQVDRAAAGLPVTFSEFEPVIATEVWLRTINNSVTPLNHRDRIVTGHGIPT